MEGVLGLVIGGIIAWHIAAYPANKLLTACEESLPRNSYCELVAEPVIEITTNKVSNG